MQLYKLLIIKLKLFNYFCVRWRIDQNYTELVNVNLKEIVIFLSFNTENCVSNFGPK